ncbi:MAG: caspase family protein [Phormidesmis sp.]
MSRDALVVGINQYHSLPKLNAPAADAEAVAARLQTQGEFRVHRLPEVVKGNRASVGKRSPVTSQMLEDSLVQLFKPKGKNVPTTALFYFSGHGLQREAGIQEGYLATSDTDPGGGNFGISLFWLRRLLQQSPVRQLIVILDCCHSGELMTFSDADPGAKAGVDRLFMAASREYESAYESLEGKHSVFTAALLSGLDPYQQDGGKVSNHGLSKHVSQQLRGEIQQPLFESSGSEIVLTRVSGLKAAFSKTPISTFTLLKKLSFGFCPYRGLSPFDEAHADYFFGRDDLIEQLLKKVDSSDFCALVGASSSGKTSLLRAGLMHHLRQGDRITGSDGWTLKLITPTQHPLKGLAAAFTSATQDDVQRARQMHQAEALLQTGGGEGLAQLVRANLLKSGETSIPAISKLWLIIDQLEELFAPTASERLIAERQLFIRCITEALKDPSTPLGVVVGLRADVSDELLAYGEFKTLVEENTVVVTPMSYDQIKDVVQRPAKKMGIELDSTMLYTLAIDTNGAPGELPLIQQTLLELWRRRDSSERGGTTPKLTMDAYMALGGVKRVLTQQASAVYQNLPEEQKRAARRIFLALCELGEGQEDRRRRAFRNELINESFPSELIDCTLDKLASERLVVISQSAIATNCCTGQGTEILSAAWQTQRREPSPLSTWFSNNVSNTPKPIIGSPRTIDIVHESLVQDWDLLRAWLADSRGVMRSQRRLESCAQEWEQRHRPTRSEYLLGGTQLQEMLAFVQLHRDELSDLAQDYIRISRKAQNRLRLRTSMLIPLALIAGIAAHILSRFIFPPAPQTPIPAEVQPLDPAAAEPSAVEPGAAEPGVSEPGKGPATEASTPGIWPSVWQRQISMPSADSTATVTSSDSLLDNPASTQLTIVPTRPDSLSEEDYMMVPAGKMASPNNPNELIEVWWIQPKALEKMPTEEMPVPLRRSPRSKPTAVGH